jgi:hypothetical protein
MLLELQPFSPYYVTPNSEKKAICQENKHNIKITQIYNPQPRRKGAAATWYQTENSLIFI